MNAKQESRIRLNVTWKFMVSTTVISSRDVLHFISIPSNIAISQTTHHSEKE